MDKKLIFFDIDGTLIDERGMVAESTVYALGELKERGHQIFLASGRSKCGVPAKIDDIGFSGMVLANGAFVEYEGKEIYRDIMNIQMVFGITEEMESKGAYLMYATRDACFVRKEATKYFQTFSDNTVVIEHHKELATEDIENIDYCNFHGDINEIAEQFASYYKIIPSSLPGKQTADSNMSSGEILKCGVSKAIGIEQIVKHLGKSRDAVISFGDGHNDIEMIQYSNIGIAMGNAVDTLKHHADRVTHNASDGGVYKSLKELGLI